ncbi:MAG: hypothetical protein M5R36_22800 [Deltaproteobacteria bacterium]|nr:hypothetical protein [Deltaproteobacteria bacterium]
MKRVFALLAAAVFWAAPAFAENVALLSGRGVATLEAGNVVAARKDALDQAMRHALEAAIPMAVLALEAEARKKAIASHVLRHPDRHFVSYETVKDAPQEDEYEIVIEAKIDLDRLARVIRALPVEKNAADGERDLLLVAIVFDKGDKRSRFKELETELIQRLDMMDYHPIDDAVAQSIVEDPAFDDAAKERLEKSRHARRDVSLPLSSARSRPSGTPVRRLPGPRSLYFRGPAGQDRRREIRAADFRLRPLVRRRGAGKRRARFCAAGVGVEAAGRGRVGGRGGSTRHVRRTARILRRKIGARGRGRAADGHQDKPRRGRLRRPISVPRRLRRRPAGFGRGGDADRGSAVQVSGIRGARKPVDISRNLLMLRAPVRKYGVAPWAPMGRAGQEVD